MIINKKVIEKVFNLNLSETYWCFGEETEKKVWIDDTGSIPYICWDAGVGGNSEISLVDFANKCKEYALKSGNVLFSAKLKTSGVCYLNLSIDGETYWGFDEKFEEPTEEEAVVKATEFIIEKEKK